MYTTGDAAQYFVIIYNEKESEKIVYIFVVVQSLSRVWLFATPWTAALQASQSFAISQSLLRFMSTEFMMPSNHLILCRPLLLSLSIFSSIRVSSVSPLFASGGQSIRASASSLVLPMNIQSWFSLELTGLISLQSKGLSRVFSSTTIQKHQFFGAKNGPTLRLFYVPTLTSVHDYWIYIYIYVCICISVCVCVYVYI